jgi:hypothetical protein
MGAAFFWDGGSHPGSKPEGAAGLRAFFIFSGTCRQEFSSFRPSLKLAPGISFSDHTQPEPESEEHYIVIHANA